MHSQQIYVSADLWRFVELIKDKLINHVAFVADSLNPDGSATKFIEQILMIQSKRTYFELKNQKMLNYEVKKLIKIV